MTNQPPPIAFVAVARVWSPLAVAVYGLVLAYPASLILAIRNWRALGLRGRILPHLAGAALISLPLIGIMIFSGSRVGRIFYHATNVMAFVYLKERLRSDLRDFADAHPEVRVETRRWYSALGWALLGILIFAFMFAGIAVPVGILRALLLGPE